MYPKYPVLDMIQRIHLRCGSFGSIVRFWILVKKRYIRFRIKNLDLDFSKETDSNYRIEVKITFMLIAYLVLLCEFFLRIFVFSLLQTSGRYLLTSTLNNSGDVSMTSFFAKKKKKEKELEASRGSTILLKTHLNRGIFNRKLEISIKGCLFIIYILRNTHQKAMS